MLKNSFNAICSSMRDTFSGDSYYEEKNLLLNISGFEGPLDLLLTLAKEQKVDLLEISILELSDQYISFINQLDTADIELAADYLVMASWLAYLKSKLLLPPEEDDKPGAEEMAAILSFRLRRLEAMRNAGINLMNRDRIGIQLYRRGMPEEGVVIKKYSHRDTMFDILKSYCDVRNRNFDRKLSFMVLPIYSIEDARHRLERLIGHTIEWTNFLDFLPTNKDSSEESKIYRRSSVASIFSAALDFAKEGLVEINQNKNFGTIRIKKYHKRKEEEVISA